MVHLMIARRRNNPAPKPSIPPRKLAVRQQVKRRRPEEIDEQNFICHIEEYQWRYDGQKTQNHRLDGMLSEHGNDIELGGGVMKSMQIPEQRDVHQTVSPISEKRRGQPI